MEAFGNESTSGGNKPCSKVSNNAADYDEADAVRKYISYGKVDNRVPWHDTVFDVSDAVKLVVDATQFQAITRDPEDYWFLVQFAFHSCLRTNLYSFHHHNRVDEDGEPMGGITSMTEDELQNPESYQQVNKVIDQYNNFTKTSKLKLVRLHRKTSVWGMFWYDYFVFTAVDETGKQAKYQAAVADVINKLKGHEIFVGSLRNVDDDKMLAILSVTGSEEITSSLLQKHVLEMAARPKRWRNHCPWMWARTT